MTDNSSMCNYLLFNELSDMSDGFRKPFIYIGVFHSLVVVVFSREPPTQTLLVVLSSTLLCAHAVRGIAKH